MSQVGSGLPRLLAERYELSEQLASGGMTSVWRGHDRVLGRHVVVKVLHPELAADERFRARFHDEAVNAARLTHPNIVALYDTGEQGGVAYIVMEMVDGPALGQVLARHGPLPPARAARLASEVCGALDYAHQTGVCHGSLKPSNVLLADDGTVKVADFSIARAAADDDPGRTGEILGPDGFLAPEVIRGEQADGRADVYGIGACLYAMLTGRPPGVDPATTIPPRSLRAGVPRNLDAIVRQAMAPDPDDRFQTVQAVAAALARSADADGPPAGDLVGVPAEPLPMRGELPPDRGFGHEGRWLGWTLALIGLAAALVVVGVTVAGDELAGLLGLGRHPATPTTKPTDTTAGRKPIQVAAATSFDPQSSDSVKQENEEQARLAIDGNRATAWRTEGYNQNLGVLKQGVGLVLDLGSPRTTGRLALTLSPGDGTKVTIYGADERPDTLEGWGPPLAGPQPAAGDSATFDLDGGRHQYLLIWFTSLPRDGDRFRGGIVEARLTS